MDAAAACFEQECYQQMHIADSIGAVKSSTLSNHSKLHCARSRRVCPVSSAIGISGLSTSQQHSKPLCSSMCTQLAYAMGRVRMMQPSLTRLSSKICVYLTQQSHALISHKITAVSHIASSSSSSRQAALPRTATSAC